MTIELELPAAPEFEAVGRLVLGGVGARLGLPADRITDFQHALHATLRQQPSKSTLVLTMRPTPEDLCLTLGPFDSAATPDRGMGDVVSTLVDEIATHESGNDLWVDLQVMRRRLPPAG